MTDESTYTYQGGRKLPLARLTTHFISRAAKKDLLADYFEPLQNVSPHAWTVRTTENTIDDDIRRARQIAPAYAAYVVEESGSLFLITDRIFVRFRSTDDAAEGAARQFGARHGLTLI